MCNFLGNHKWRFAIYRVCDFLLHCPHELCGCCGLLCMQDTDERTGRKEMARFSRAGTKGMVGISTAASKLTGSMCKLLSMDGALTE